MSPFNAFHASFGWVHCRCCWKCLFWEIFEGPWPSFHHHGLKSVIRQTSASPPHDLKREGHGQRTPTSLDILCLAKQLVVSTGGANPISWFELWLTIRRSGWCAGCGRFSIAPSSALAARGTLAPAPIATFAPHGWRCRGPVFDGLPVRLWADKWLGQDPSWLGIGALSSQAAGVENQWYLIYIFWTSKIMNCLNQWVATCTAHYLIPTIQSKGSFVAKNTGEPPDNARNHGDHKLTKQSPCLGLGKQPWKPGCPIAYRRNCVKLPCSCSRTEGLHGHSLHWKGMLHWDQKTYYQRWLKIRHLMHNDVKYIADLSI